MRKTLTLCLVIAATVFFGTAIAQAGLNIDFGNNGTPLDTYGGAADQAGVWNSTGLNFSGDLLGLDGNATSVTYDLSASSPGGYWSSTPSVDGDMFFSNNGSGWSLTLDGLADGAYDVYFYQALHISVGTGTYEVNGVAMEDMSGNFAPGELTEGVSWNVARVTVTDGTLNVSSTSTSGYRGLAGMQVAVAPEPVSSVLFVVGGTVLGFRKRFSKKREVLAV